MANEKHIIEVEAKYNTLAGLRKELKDSKDNLLAVTNEFTKFSNEAKVAGERLQVAQAHLGNATKTIKEFGTSSAMSTQQLLRMGESITVVVAGLSIWFNRMKSIIDQGSQYGQMYDKFVELAGGIDQANSMLETMRIASGNALNRQELIDYTAKMKLLGFGLTDTTKLLDIVKERTHQLKIGFEEGNERLQRFIITGNRRGIQELGINVADVEKEMIKLAGTSVKNIKQLDLETQQRIRTQSILNLFGDTLDNIGNKELTEAERIKGMETAVANARLEFGRIASHELIAFMDSLGLTDKAMRDVIGTAGGIGYTLGSILPVLAALKIAFPAAFSAVLPILGAVGLAIGQVIMMIDMTKKSLDAMGRTGVFIHDVMSGENIGEAYQKGVTEYEKEQGLGFEGKLTDFTKKLLPTQSIQDNITKTIEMKNLQDQIKEQLDAMNQKHEKTGKTLKENTKELKIQAGIIPKIYGGEYNFGKIAPIPITEGNYQKILDQKLIDRGGKRRAENLSPEELAKQSDEMANKIQDAFSQALSVTSQISGLLGQGASEIVNAFQTAYGLASSIISIIGMFASFFNPASVIGGFGTGGIPRASGGAIWGQGVFEVGEKGRELIAPVSPAMVIPNNLIPMFNYLNSQPSGKSFVNGGYMPNYGSGGSLKATEIKVTRDAVHYLVGVGDEISTRESR